MDGDNFILSYVRACAGGNLALPDCGPVWQFGVIAVLFIAAVSFLFLLILQPQRQLGKP